MREKTSIVVKFLHVVFIKEDLPVKSVGCVQQNTRSFELNIIVGV